MKVWLLLFGSGLLGVACVPCTSLGDGAKDLTSSACAFTELDMNICLSDFSPPEASNVITDGSDSSDEYVILSQPLDGGWLELGLTTQAMILDQGDGGFLDGGWLQQGFGQQGCAITQAIYYPTTGDAGAVGYPVEGMLTVLSGLAPDAGLLPGDEVDVELRGATYQTGDAGDVPIPDVRITGTLGGPGVCEGF